MITAPTSGVNIGEFSDVDIVLNDAKLWTTGTAICATPSDTSDVQSTATHEVGHALGLGHVTGKHCMTSSSQWCSGGTILKTAYENLEQRTIQTGDQDGYEYLYVDTDNVRETFGGGPNDKPIAGADETDASQAGVVALPNPFISQRKCGVSRWPHFRHIREHLQHPRTGDQGTPGSAEYGTRGLSARVGRKGCERPSYGLRSVFPSRGTRERSAFVSACAREVSSQHNVGQACTELENAQTPCRPDPRAPLRRR